MHTSSTYIYFRYIYIISVKRAIYSVKSYALRKYDYWYSLQIAIDADRRMDIGRLTVQQTVYGSMNREGR